MKLDVFASLEVVLRTCSASRGNPPVSLKCSDLTHRIEDLNLSSCYR